MKVKLWALPVLVLSVLFTSCFNNLKNPKETSVSFYMDEATVSKILKTNFNARSASDIIDSQETYIDVTLCGDNEQTQTELLSKQIQMEFKDVFVGSRVYAKAQIYKYEDSEKSVKNIYYRGESSKITVREGKNVISIKLGPATLTVTFDSNGGSEVPSQLVLTGSAATEPEKPVKPADKKKYSKDNFAFAGWFTDAELTKEYNFELPVKDDLTLYAKWLPDFVFVEGATVNDYLVTGRNIKISDLFVSDHEVTQAEYLAVTNENPSNNKKTDEKANEYPVENVTWLEAIKYCNKLSESQGLDPCYKINGSEVTCTLSANGYRLPTEAEWEYISTKSNRTNIDFDSMALYSSNSQNQTWEVDNRRADELGLCNVLGNVAEWCFDIYSDTVAKSTGPTGPMAVAGTSANRVVRGGSFQSSAAECTPQTRACADPAEKSAAIGFRVVRTVVYEFKIARNTVTFEPNGGSAVDIQIVVQGDCATQPSNPTKTGYNFQGWKYADEDFDFSTSITQDILLEAKWEAIQYTIKFDKGTSTTTVTMPDQVFTYDVAVSLPGNTFEPDTGMKFAGWTTDPSSTNIEYENEQVIKNLSAVQGDEITLYALWIDRDACAISYLDIPDNATNSNPSSFLIRDAITLNDPERPYYSFSGWYLVKEDSTEVAISSSWDAGTYQTNIKLRATWTPIEYNWTFERNGGNWNSYTPASTYNVTQPITLPVSTQITKTGYDFAGWYDGWDAVNGTVSGNNITGWAAGDKHEESGITLYAKWIPGDNHYKVQHWQQKKTGGENIATSYDCVEEQTIDENVKTGDTTAATAKAYNGFTSKSFDQTTVAADGSTVINIYYNRNTITYTYTLGSDETWGASESPNGDNNVVKEGLYGATVVLPQATKTGYDFGNWKSGDITLTSTSTYGLENKTFTATWGIQTYEIRYHLNGGSYDNFTGGTYDSEYDIYTKTFTTNDGLINLTVPEREGFTFGDGGDEVWFTDDRTFTTTISSIDATQTRYLKDWDVYAKWTYTVTFNSKGGSAVSTQIKSHLYGVDEPSDPTKNGYDFAGWYSDSACQNLFTDFYEVTGTITLYAKWNYTITYKNSVTDQVIGEDTYYETAATVRPETNPTYTGYAFDDWYDSSACSTTYTFGSASTNTTVYARFYNTLYVKNGGSSTAEGTRESASLDYIDTALDKIINMDPPQPADWIIQVSGSYSGHPYTLFRDTITTENASSITIQGKTGNDTDILDRGCTTKTTNGYVFNVVTAVPVTIKNIKITGAYVNGSGGGITVGATANVTLGEGALIQGNKAGTNGGGVYVAGNAESVGKLTILSGAEISNNSTDLSATPTTSGNGGGIYSKGIVVMKGGTISGNSASRGGGVYLTKDANNITSVFYMSGDACIGDSSSHTPYYASATNRSNYADGTNENGGGIYIYAGSAKFGVTCNLDTMEEEDELLSGGIYYNYASGYGGGIYSSSTIYGEANIVIKSGNISYNTSGMGGGGIYFTSSTSGNVSIIEMSGGTISQNYVPVGKKGGAVALSAGTAANTFLVMSGAANIPKSEDHNNYIAFTSSSNTYGGIMISGALSSSSGPFMLDAASCTTANFNPTSLINKYGSVSDSDFSTAVSKFNLSYVACIGSTNYYTQKDAYDAIIGASENVRIELGEACTGFMLGNSQTSSGNKLAYAMKANETANTFSLYVQNEATIQLQPDSSNLLKDCVKFTAMDLRGFDTSLVTKFDSMFEGCYNVRYIYLSTFTNTSAESAISMFKGCENLEEIIATADFDLSTKLDVTTGENIFNGCTSLKGGSNSAYSTYGDGYSYAKLDFGSSSPGYFKSE